MDQMVTDDKLFGCPYCGFRINQGEEQCPRCGNNFGSGTKFECPFCGDLVAPGSAECPSCHINFGEFQDRVKKKAKVDSMDTLLMDIIKLEATEVEKSGKKLSCPHCDLLLTGSETRCPRCMTDLTEGAAFQCPVCGEFVIPDSTKCSECGASFEGEGEAEQEHEAVESALTDILSSAGHEGPLPEIERRPIVEEPAPELPEPTIESAPEPEPSPEPPPAVEPAPEPEPEVAPPDQPAAPKKVRQRKLKAKPSGAKPQKPR